MVSIAEPSARQPPRAWRMMAAAIVVALAVVLPRLAHAEMVEGTARIKVNGDRDPEINARYAPDGAYFPRTMVLEPNGELAAEVHGGNPTYRYYLDYKSTRELVGVMKRAAAVR